ncbi:hypothetical protein H0H92_004258 [Tricholoma furcatifolium]|nr:hypothetical protein H0H92_004258 [Tricholoma furcatifolium]
MSLELESSTGGFHPSSVYANSFFGVLNAREGLRQRQSVSSAEPKRTLSMWGPVQSSRVGDGKPVSARPHRPSLSKSMSFPALPSARTPHRPQPSESSTIFTTPTIVLSPTSMDFDEKTYPVIEVEKKMDKQHEEDH